MRQEWESGAWMLMQAIQRRHPDIAPAVANKAAMDARLLCFFDERDAITVQSYDVLNALAEVRAHPEAYATKVG